MSCYSGSKPLSSIAAVALPGKGEKLCYPTGLSSELPSSGLPPKEPTVGSYL